MVADPAQLAAPPHIGLSHHQSSSPRPPWPYLARFMPGKALDRLWR